MNFVMNNLQRRLFLMWMCNKYGDFKVSTHKPPTEKFPEGIWTKHTSVMKCWETGELFKLDYANNRSILDCEIVLDIDPEKNETPENIKKRYNQVIKILKSKGCSFNSFFSGSRGYHIHIIFEDLNKDRFGYRNAIINKFNCDKMKIYDKSMIALEFTPHWKTGNPKILLESTTHKPPYPEGF